MCDSSPDEEEADEEEEEEELGPIVADPLVVSDRVLATAAPVTVPKEGEGRGEPDADPPVNPLDGLLPVVTPCGVAVDPLGDVFFRGRPTPDDEADPDGTGFGVGVGIGAGEGEGGEPTGTATV